MITSTVPTPAVTGRARAPRMPESREISRTWKGRKRLVTSDAAWGATASAILILIAGAMTLATSQPWLFAALGPTAVGVASSPGHPTSRFHSIVVGHLTALVCAWLVMLLVGVADAPALAASGVVTVARVWASAMAIAVTALVQPSLRAYHPPAAATALLVTMGTYHLTWRSSLSMMGGVLVVALVGEWFQRIRLKDEPVRR